MCTSVPLQSWKLKRNPKVPKEEISLNREEEKWRMRCLEREGRIKRRDVRLTLKAMEKCVWGLKADCERTQNELEHDWWLTARQMAVIGSPQGSTPTKSLRYCNINTSLFMVVFVLYYSNENLKKSGKNYRNARNCMMYSKWPDTWIWKQKWLSLYCIIIQYPAKCSKRSATISENSEK